VPTWPKIVVAFWVGSIASAAWLPRPAEAQHAVGSASSPSRSPGSTTTSSAPAVGPGDLERNENNFLLLDRDQDGSIEFQEDFTDLPEATRRHFVQQLERWDVDKDGRLSRGEFLGTVRAGWEWKTIAAVLLLWVAFGALCLIVDATLDLDRRELLLYAVPTLLVALVLAWFCRPDWMMSPPPYVLLCLVTAGVVLGAAVLLGKPTAEEPIEPFVPAGTVPSKRYIIRTGRAAAGPSSSSQPTPRTPPSPPPRRPPQPPRPPRRPPGTP
jgi:hypothetical protein